MKLFQPVIWSKGTFLTPQHLQAQDRFIENQLHFQVSALNFRPWGFSELSIDQQALASGDLSLLSAQGIFPDGLLFDIPNSDPPPEPRPLGSYFEARQESLDVYLTIPHFVEKGLNVSPPNHSTATRYISDIAMYRDENSGASEKPIQVGRKKFRLTMEGENREGSVAMQIARVKRTSAGTFQLDPTFAPPVLNIDASDFLMSIARRLLEILAARSADLSGGRRQRNQSLADFTVQDVGNFWLLYTVNSHILLLRHLFETSRGHPESLFSVMLSLAGALTTFSAKIQPRDLPLYDHENLGSCFAQLDEKLRTLLETVVPRNFVSLPLKLVQPSIYAAAVDDDKYFVNTRMYLAISAEVNEADLINKVPHLTKVSSANQIDQLVKQALPGVKLTHVVSPPNPIPVKMKYQYFSLNQSGQAWDAITRARNIAVYIPGDLVSPQLELIVVLPGSA
jgi:type VI secretion system protein ImpJ